MENTIKKPLKTLDQSVFDGQDEKWKSAAMDKNGKIFFFTCTSDKLVIDGDGWDMNAEGLHEVTWMTNGSPVDNWQDSAIDRADNSQDMNNKDWAEESYQTIVRALDDSRSENANLKAIVNTLDDMVAENWQLASALERALTESLEQLHAADSTKRISLTAGDLLAIIGNSSRPSKPPLQRIDA